MARANWPIPGMMTLSARARSAARLATTTDAPAWRVRVQSACKLEVP